MCNANIYAINTATGGSINAGSIYPIAQTVRKCGAFELQNGALIIKRSGCYMIDAVVTIAATAVGVVSVELQQDGTPVQGAIGSGNAAAIGDWISIPISAIVKVKNDCVCSDGAALSFVVSGQNITTENLTIRAVKL